MDALQEEDARASKKKIFAEALIKAKTDEEIKQVLDEDVGRVIGLHNVLKDLRDYRNLSVKQIEHPDCRGIWIYGKAGTGKTHLARKGPWIRDDSTVFLKQQNKWWDLY